MRSNSVLRGILEIEIVAKDRKERVGYILAF